MRAQRASLYAAPTCTTIEAPVYSYRLYGRYYLETSGGVTSDSVQRSLVKGSPLRSVKEKKKDLPLGGGLKNYFNRLYDACLPACVQWELKKFLKTWFPRVGVIGGLVV